MASRIPPQTVTRLLRKHNYYTNSHYMSNIILIRNTNTYQPDTLYIFCNDALHTTYFYYKVISHIDVSLSGFNIKHGQYINALQLNKATGNPNALIQADEITLISMENVKQEKSGLFNLIITSKSNAINPTDHPIAILFEKNQDFQHFISICKIASRFNANRFSLTILNLNENNSPTTG